MTGSIVIGLFTIVPTVIAIVAATRQRARKKRADASPFVRAPHTAAPSLGEADLTPSERVLCASGADVDPRHLVEQALHAAIRAHVDAGCLRIESDRGGMFGMSTVAVAVPTGVTRAWPSQTLEGRLLFDESRPLVDVLVAWLEERTTEPWLRAAEQVRVAAALRGLVALEFNETRRRYPLNDRYAGIGRPALAAAPCDAAIRAAIAAALEASTAKRNDSRDQEVTGTNPWLAESERDRSAFGLSPDQRRLVFGEGAAAAAATPAIRARLNHVVHPAVSVPLSVVGVVLIARYAPALLVPLGVLAAALTVLMYGVPELPGAAAAQLTFARAVYTANDEPFPDAWTRARHALFAPAVAAIMLGLWLWARFLAVAGLAVVWYFMLKRGLRAEVARVIQERVTAAPRPSQAVPAARESVPLRISRSISGADADLEIVDASVPQAVSDETRSRIAHVRERSAALRTAYRRAVVVLGGLVTIVTYLAWLADRRQKPEEWPLGTTLLFGATLLISRRGAVSRRVAARWQAWWSTIQAPGPAGDASAMRARAVKAMERAERHGGEGAATMSIAMWLVPMMGYVWVLLAAIRSVSGIAQPWRTAFFAAYWALAIGYLAWLRREARTLERRFPAPAPLSLLALRVFNSGSLDEFMHLTRIWRFVGTHQQLDGPDTAGSKDRDVMLLVTGKIDEAVVSRDADLDAAIDAFAFAPDDDLRFPLNSVQCTDATWKDALKRLMGDADVALMDLSGFSPENQGCIYELTQLARRVPRRRVLLLVDDSTDLEFLRSVVRQVWPPGAASTDGPVRAIHIGGALSRRPDESVYAWRTRMTKRLDAMHLSSFLVDAALPQVSRTRPAPARWAQPLPARTRRIVFRVGKPLLALLLVVGLINLWIEWT